MKTVSKLLMLTILLHSVIVRSQEQKPYAKKLASFEKIIIGPHINATLIKSEVNSIEINHSNINIEKINTQTNGNTLRVYLEKSKIWPKTYKIKKDGHKDRVAYNKNAKVDLTIYYTNLKSISFRGEKKLDCLSELSDNSKFKISLYGETTVILNSLNADCLKIRVYGENKLSIGQGSFNRQIVKSYGENIINTTELKSHFIKSKSYGESKLNYYCDDKLKVFSIGESDITWSGQGRLNKTIVIGENYFCKK